MPRRNLPRGGGGTQSPTVERTQFPQALRGKLTAAIDDVRRQAGDDAALVLRVPLLEGVPIAAVSQVLTKAQLAVIAQDARGEAVVALRSSADLTALMAGLDVFEAGPRVKKSGELAKSTVWDALAYIDVEKLSRPNPVGPRLAEQVGIEGVNIADAETYVLDVEFWRDESGREQGRRDVEFLRELCGEGVLDTFVGDAYTLARIRVTGSILRTVLKRATRIAQAEIPAQPAMDFPSMVNATADNFPVPVPPPEDADQICVMDSGVVDHPLLVNYIGDASAFLTATTTTTDQDGHGTHVSGLAVFGNVLEHFQQGSFSSDLQLLSARILNDQAKLDDEKLFENQIDEVVRYYTSPPFQCRVFNLSFATFRPALAETGGEQTAWARALDRIARERKVLFVVAAGNRHPSNSPTVASDEDALAKYPHYLLEDDAQLADPATSAIALTVGSLTEFDAPAQRLGSVASPIVRAVAPKNHPSPFTRIGPGVNGGFKPELVDYGGNLEIFPGMGGNMVFPRPSSNPGTSVLSFDHRITQQLFCARSGTSQAAPRVANLAARLIRPLRETLSDEPHPNLLRAMLACGATIPSESSLFGSEIVGYGRPDPLRVLQSDDSRPVLLFQGEMEIDHFALFQIPTVREFTATQGKKTITVALAFDPYILPRSRQYLGVHMDFDVVNGMTVDEIIQKCRAFTEEEKENRKTINRLKKNDESTEDIEEPPGGLPSNRLIDLLPKKTLLANSTLQRRAATFTQRKALSDPLYLVVRCLRNGAPETIKTQSYAVAVMLEAEDDRIYNAVRARVQIRQQVRVRV
jgi:hypothetical protein